jgi:hypothetical protein
MLGKLLTKSPDGARSSRGAETHTCSTKKEDQEQSKDVQRCIVAVRLLSAPASWPPIAVAGGLTLGQQGLEGVGGDPLPLCGRDVYQFPSREEDRVFPVTAGHVPVLAPAVPTHGCSWYLAGGGGWPWIRRENKWKKQQC